MTLAPQKRLAEVVATFDDISEERKRFLIEYIAASDPGRLLMIWEKCDLREAAFMRACTEQTQLAA